jgi:hypothetical protein
MKYLRPSERLDYCGGEPAHSKKTHGETGRISLNFLNLVYMTESVRHCATSGSSPSKEAPVASGWEID